MNAQEKSGFRPQETGAVPLTAPEKRGAALNIEDLPTFAEVTRSTCLTCMGRRVVPYSIRNKFTGRLETVQATCLRCNGTGRVDNH